MQSDERESRYERGLAMLQALHGKVGEDAVGGLGDLGRFIVEFAYGDIWSRSVFGARERAIATVAMLAVLPGLEKELWFHIRAALRAGLTPKELEEIIIQSVPYAGFPPAMNAMNLLQRVLREQEEASEG